jgi:hypothetical protein
MRRFLLIAGIIALLSGSTALESPAYAQSGADLEADRIREHIRTVGGINCDVTLTVPVRNVGDTAAGPHGVNFVVTDGVSPISVPPFNSSGLGPKKRAVYEATFQVSTGTSWSVTVTADHLGQVAETNEGNNVATTSFSCPRR